MCTSIFNQAWPRCPCPACLLPAHVGSQPQLLGFAVAGPKGKGQAGVGPCGGCRLFAGKMEHPQCEQKIMKVSIAEILRCFEHPISEEQAWAICFQCCYKMQQLSRGLCPPLHSVFIKELEALLVVLLCSSSNV
uniref:KIND domain-containing protein n=1 Tax=Falco tinnunculus TaxID=100819 RepID=A0A8C4TZ71_FALTI